MAYIQNLTLSPGIVLNVDGPKIEVLVNGARYGPDYSLSGVQNAIQQQIDTYNGLVATLKPNDPKLAQVNSIISTLNSAKSLLNPGGPADTAIKKDNEEAEAERLAAEEARKKEAEAAKTTATPAPTPTATVPAPPPANTKPALAGAASDDSGATQPKPAGSSPGPIKSPAAAAGAGGTTPSTAKSTADSGSTKTGVAKSGTNTPANSGTGPSAPTNASTGAYNFQHSILSDQQVATAAQPGKRLKNPLGEFSSYTYQITLYMITPDAYEAFVLSGRRKINVLNEASGGAANGGAFIIAQSGGVNNTATKRAPGFELDYGIDNLVLKQRITGKATGAAVNVTEVSFNITEPYGFSFLSNLRKAGDAIAEYSKAIGKGEANPTRQFFVLGIRFLGYDASGRIMQPNTKMGNNGVVDPMSLSGELFEHFFDINIYSMKFKIDGRMVTYQCKGVTSGPGKGFSTTKGMVQTDTTVEASTVGVAIDQLMVKLNKEQGDQAKGTPPSRRHPIKYEIIWLPGTEDIINASLVSDARTEKSRTPGSGAKTTEQSNDATAIKQQSANTGATTITFSPQPIVQAINQAISQSSYLEEAMTVVYTSKLEADPNTKAQASQKPSYQKKNVSWYNCHPQITEIKWDDLTKDWAYKISYLIQKYETPIVDSPMITSTKAYPGPHKRYDYWFTGENTEIIRYEQTMDNAYYNTVVSAGDAASGSASNAIGGANSSTPAQPGMQSPQPRIGSTGYGIEAQNSYITALYDYKAYATAKINILGDPDFFATDPVYSEEVIYNKVYGADGFSLNANGGQVFIEIDFKEAVDYTSQTGTLKINDSILFWKNQGPANKSKKIKGISYLLTTVTSTFNSGSFTQLLECVINDFGDKSEREAALAAEDSFSKQATDIFRAAEQSGDTTGTTPGNDKNTSAQTTGTPQEQTFNKNNVQNNQTNDTNKTATNPNDDSSSTNTKPKVPPQGRTG